MDILKKIQNQPEKIRKVILWSITILTGISLFILLVKNFQQKYQSFELEDFKGKLNFPSLEKNLKSLPDLDLEIPATSTKSNEK